MEQSSDTEVWNYAAESGYTIVSKDSVFHQRSLLADAPPRVIWIRQGNCSVAETAHLLRERFVVVEQFHAREEKSFLALS
jgi:predicted nuclease of predicted toxin-antitoxin system